ERGLIMPDEFVPLVEKTVVLRAFTSFVVETVLQRWSAWAMQGVRLPIAVNLSPRSLLDRQLPEMIRELLSRYAVPPEFLKLELTESFLMADSGRSNSVLDALSAVGV